MLRANFIFKISVLFYSNYFYFKKAINISGITIQGTILNFYWKLQIFKSSTADHKCDVGWRLLRWQPQWSPKASSSPAICPPSHHIAFLQLPQFPFHFLKICRTFSCHELPRQIPYKSQPVFLNFAPLLPATFPRKLVFAMQVSPQPLFTLQWGGVGAGAFGCGLKDPQNLIAGSHLKDRYVWFVAECLSEQIWNIDKNIMWIPVHMKTNTGLPFFM